MKFDNLQKVVRENRTEILKGLSLLDEMMEETEEEKSRRRSALKYEYFRTMTPYDNI